MTVALIALVIGIATIEASIVSTQDWYDNACGANCTQYLVPTVSLFTIHLLNYIFNYSN